VLSIRHLCTTTSDPRATRKGLDVAQARGGCKQRRAAQLSPATWVYDDVVATLGELVASSALAPLLGYVSRPGEDPVVRGVSLIEDLGHLEHVREQSIVLLTRSVSTEVSSYGFDMALRAARSRSVAAVVLSAADVASVTSITTAIALRSGAAILATSNDADLAVLAQAIGRELAGDAGAALLCVHTAVRVVEAHPPDGTIDALLQRASAALGVPISIQPSKPTGRTARPIVIDGGVEAWVTTPAQEGDLAMGVEVVLQAVGASVATAMVHDRRAQALPTQSRQEILTDLLSATPKAREQAVRRARSTGLPIDAWHVVVLMDFQSLADPPAGEELATYEARMRLGAAVLRQARATGGNWHEARLGEAFVLVNTSPQDPGADGAGRVASVMEDVLLTLRNKVQGSIVRCGVGMAAAGPSGLLASLAEAKAAAVTARTSQQANTAVAFDSFGLRRALVDWYASDTAREAATSVLAPLANLGGVRGERLIQTLHVYLDERCSLTRTAQRLSLHRNAVAYRINRAFELLEVDQDNPDDLLLLQLACRARELAQI
jgi:sugar diacid utilization regulator